MHYNRTMPDPLVRQNAARCGPTALPRYARTNDLLRTSCEFTLNRPFACAERGAANYEHDIVICALYANRLTQTPSREQAIVKFLTD